MSDLDILVTCNKRIRERYNAITGGNEPVVAPSGSLEIETLLHGDVVDADASDYVARYIGKSQWEQMRLAEAQGIEFNEIGGYIGLAEQCIVLGAMYERMRRSLVVEGRAQPKPRDFEDGIAT